jgi:hypothetical protein
MARGKSNTDIFGAYPRKQLKAIGAFSGQLEKALDAFVQNNPFQEKLTKLRQELNQLMELGIERGRLDFRDGKYARIKYPSVGGKVPVKYIGKDPEKIQEVRDKIARVSRVDALEREIREVESEAEDFVDHAQGEIMEAHDKLKELIEDWKSRANPEPARKRRTARGGAGLTLDSLEM